MKTPLDRHQPSGVYSGASVLTVPTKTVSQQLRLIRLKRILNYLKSPATSFCKLLIPANGSRRFKLCLEKHKVGYKTLPPTADRRASAEQINVVIIRDPLLDSVGKCPIEKFSALIGGGVFLIIENI